jgi:hypothetical protein
VNLLRTSVYLVIPTGPEDSALRTARLAASTEITPAGLPREPTWRTLEVVVSPEKINVTWDQLRLKEVPRKEFDRMANFLLTNSPVRPREDPRFQPEDALGLLVHLGTAWFRSCTLEPLPEE